MGRERWVGRPLLKTNASRWFTAGVLAMVCAVAGVSMLVGASRAQDDSQVYDRDPAALIAAYKHVEVASVSDAMEQLLHRRMYLSHRMQPLFPARFAGYALTVRLKKEENDDPHALDGMLAAIDNGDRDSVYVMSIEDGTDIAGMGGLMGTAMEAREFSGAVIDGSVRDTAYLRKIGFPVYATGITPATAVGHYRFAGSQVPVVCDGVPVRPGDIVTADSDGVAVVPRERAVEVLRLAQQLDFQEHSMYPLIEKMESIESAVKQFGRL
ncbi:MAG TPA: RraA family protein [Terracidiphilus sp.]|nr:RraA family protein [Terracidiphilus sp.]